jgi:hypothetical protein
MSQLSAIERFISELQIDLGISLNKQGDKWIGRIYKKSVVVKSGRGFFEFDLEDRRKAKKAWVSKKTIRTVQTLTRSKEVTFYGDNRPSYFIVKPNSEIQIRKVQKSKKYDIFFFSI